MRVDGEAELQRSLVFARQQFARFWELRTAVTLAKHWQTQGRHRDAFNLLDPVYRWFTEGFDTADLKAAKALLEELTGLPPAQARLR